MNELSLKTWAAFWGMVISYLFGTWNSLLNFFLFACLVDYITGIIASIVEGNGLSSRYGFWGITKKGLMILIILLAHQMDILLESNFVMNGAIYFYIANELISICENCARMGIPLPNQIKRIAGVFKDKAKK